MSAKKNQKRNAAPKLLDDLEPHEAVGALINTALQFKAEGVPFEVVHQGDEIIIYIKGFNYLGDGVVVLAQPEAVQS